jgi:lipopolysaccharide biosynthesis regulator YciM
MTCAKVSYALYEQAVAAAVRCLDAPFKPRQMQPYKCPTCKAWHLTSKPYRDSLNRFPAIEAKP